MNHIFVFLIILGLIVGGYASTRDALKADGFMERLSALKAIGEKMNKSIVDMSKTAVDICIGYIGIMALWLGIMKIAEEAGLVALIARMLKPIMIRLFPRVPVEHPAMGSMIMNLAANMLGLDNAATPLGLKAMRDLQTLNADKDTATDSMIMFMAINTSSITLIPFGVMAWRASMGSINPQIILGPATLATLCSTIGAIITVTIFIKLVKPSPDFYIEYIEGKHDVLKKAQEDWEKDGLNK